MIHVRLWIRIYLLQLNYLFGVGIERKHILNSWVADRSTGFLLAHGSHLNIWIAEKLGKRVIKSEIFNTRITMTRISWYYVWKRNLVNDTINYSGFYEHFGTSIQLLAKLNAVIVKSSFKCSNYASTRWLVVSFLTGYLSEFGFSRYTFSRDDWLNGYNVCVFTSFAGR